MATFRHIYIYLPTTPCITKLINCPHHYPIPSSSSIFLPPSYFAGSAPLTPWIRLASIHHWWDNPTSALARTPPPPRTPSVSWRKPRVRSCSNIPGCWSPTGRRCFSACSWSGRFWGVLGSSRLEARLEFEGHRSGRSVVGSNGRCLPNSWPQGCVLWHSFSIRQVSLESEPDKLYIAYIHRHIDKYIIQSDLVYPNTLVSIKTDCETLGLLNHCK